MRMRCNKRGKLLVIIGTEAFYNSEILYVNFSIEL